MGMVQGGALSLTGRTPNVEGTVGEAALTGGGHSRAIRATAGAIAPTLAIDIAHRLCLWLEARLGQGSISVSAVRLHVLQT